MTQTAPAPAETLTYEGNAGSATLIIDRLLALGFTAAWNEEVGIRINATDGGGDQVVKVGDTVTIESDRYRLTPVDRRPVRRASMAAGEDTVVVYLGRHYLYRQIGWHGQSGRFYALDEKPADYERGSFGPLWISVDSWPVDENAGWKALCPAVPGGRPTMPMAEATLYDFWLTPHGLDGWLPEGAEIVVENGQVTYPQWISTDGNPSGWDRDRIALVKEAWSEEERKARGGDPAGDEVLMRLVTVPLVVPVTDRVRELFAMGSLTLTER